MSVAYRPDFNIGKSIKVTYLHKIERWFSLKEYQVTIVQSCDYLQNKNQCKSNGSVH